MKQYLTQIDKSDEQRQTKKRNLSDAPRNFGFSISETKIILAIKFLFLFLLFSSPHGKGQTIYGVSGIIKTPSAYVVNNDDFVFCAAYFKDYHINSKELIRQWTININAGIFSRFELGLRLSILPDVTGDSPIFDVSFDRILSGKYILFKEKKAFPQITFGMQDIVGTRLHNSTYLATSKTIQIESYSFLLNLGYGTKLNDLFFGNAGNHHFIGFFGGTEIGFKERIYLIAEYDARDFNSGLKLVVKDWFNFNFSLFKMEYPSMGISLKFSI